MAKDTIMQQLLRQREAERKAAESGEQQNPITNHISGPLKNYPMEKASPERQAQPETPEVPAYDNLQDELRMIQEEQDYQLKHARQEKSRYYVGKVFQIFLIVLCVYLVFLIYGVLKTSYVYNEKGEVVPLVVPVESIREKAEFEVVSTQYLQSRTLYEEVLKLDYRLGMATKTGEDPLVIAPEYEKILEKISKLSVQMGAQTVPAQYTQPYNMLISWVKNDIALYCQYISRAITQNNVTDMNNALVYKDSMYSNFMRITEILTTLGGQVDNVDVKIIYDWSPEQFIEQYSGGIN